MERVILHMDANSFYASVECLYRPELRGKPVAVCGDPEARHGIVLTATPPAKRAGVRVGMAIWQARQICPELHCVPPDYGLYVHFSRMMRAMAEEYTDRVEAFGLDENWLDISNPDVTMDDGAELAHLLRRRVKEELGITVSVGVSFSKVFAKAGSDLKKPDAVTVIRRENFRQILWPLPASTLLFVGRKTERKLNAVNIRTVGDLAMAPDSVMLSLLGKNGLMLKDFAAGEDHAPVMPVTVESAIKSVGNSTTTPRDMVTADEARCVYWLLAETVGSRLRENGFRCRCVTVTIRTADLHIEQAQCTLPQATRSTEDIALAACRLFEERFTSFLPLRSVGLACSRLTPDDEPCQLDLLGDCERRDRRERADDAVDGLRRRFGHQMVRRGTTLLHDSFASINPKDDHTIHPVPFYAG